MMPLRTRRNITGPGRGVKSLGQRSQRYKARRWVTHRVLPGSLGLAGRGPEPRLPGGDGLALGGTVSYLSRPVRPLSGGTTEIVAAPPGRTGRARAARGRGGGDN